jgi:hypothetical protein
MKVNCPEIVWVTRLVAAPWSNRQIAHASVCESSAVVGPPPSAKLSASPFSSSSSKPIFWAMPRQTPCVSSSAALLKLLGVVEDVLHGASPGPVWPVGKLSLGLDQFPGPTSTSPASMSPNPHRDWC